MVQMHVPLDDSEQYFLRWREVLDERATAAVESLSSVRGVVAIVLAGSLGRDEPWPLSDIDIVPIYATGEEARAGRLLSALAEELEAAWEAEGGRTDLDVGNIWFTDREGREAVGWSGEQTVPHLADFRWYHGIDKAHGGHAAFDPTGVAAGFLQWVSRIRFAPEIVSSILKHVGDGLSRALDQAASSLKHGDDDGAAIALHRVGYLMMDQLMESTGLSRSSFGRLGTRFDSAMTACGRAETGRAVMDVMLLSPDDVERRFADASGHVQRRHQLSLRARQLVGEGVTPLNDRRDVLLAFTTFAFRRRTAPLARWTGVGCDRKTMIARLEIARGLAGAMLAQTPG